MMASVDAGVEPEFSAGSGGAGCGGSAADRKRQVLPGVFLMTDSFETGGSERQFAALARALDSSAFRLHLGCIRKRGPFLDGLGEAREFRLGGSLYGLRSLRARLRLARHLRQIDAAVAHAFDFYSNLTLVPAARLAGVRVLIGSQRQLGDLLTRNQFRVQLAVFHLSDMVVCNSHVAAKILIEHGLPGRKVTVIGNGLPPEAFAEAVPALARRPGVLHVGMIARMNARYKNHHVFLRAASRLQVKFPTAEYLLVGDGPLRQDLECDAENLGLGGKIHFLGQGHDIPALLACMDISVVPSASESLSNVALESMAAGVAVVATDVGGNSELLAERRGLLVPPDDDETLAAALERLLRDATLRTELARNGRRHAQANFTIQNMQQRHEELYTELLARKNWKPSPTRIRIPSASPRLRVAIVAPTLRWVGGQAVQADLLLRHWRHDADVEARFIPTDTPLSPGLRWVERIPFLRTLVREPLYCAALWRDLKDVDIAHIFSASYWSFLVSPAPAWLIARLRSKKTVINYRSAEAQNHLRRSRTARSILRMADKLVVPSAYLIDVFREFDLQAQAVPNIVDLSQFAFRTRSPLRPHLVCTRGFHPYYSVDVVVRAFAEVHATFPAARLDLVGKGVCEAAIRQLVGELDLCDSVCFTGVASRQEIGRFYDQADIFINASHLDNMPVSVLEAFASGMPVVTTAPEGIRYFVEHERTGLLSEPGDAVTLAQNVIRVLRDPVLAGRLIANAREESRRYCWPAVREQWLNLYRSLPES